jgi:hypothetical protein
MISAKLTLYPNLFFEILKCLYNLLLVIPVTTNFTMKNIYIVSYVQTNGHVMSLKGSEMKIDKTPTLQHFHNPIQNEDFLCRKALQHMKHRVETEPHVFPSVIYSEEVEKLQTVHKLSTEFIAEYLKPYNRFKGTFEKRKKKWL